MGTRKTRAVSAPVGRVPAGGVRIESYTSCAGDDIETNGIGNGDGVMKTTWLYDPAVDEGELQEGTGVINPYERTTMRHARQAYTRELGLGLGLREGRGAVDAGAMPDSSERQRLKRILTTPNYTQGKGSQKQLALQIPSEDHLLVWTFRWYLSRNSSALNKFLRCVDWDHVNEAQQGVELLRVWAVPDFAGLLDLLSSTFKPRSPSPSSSSSSFSSPSKAKAKFAAITAVRAYAVQRLHAATDQELLQLLLPLTQALRHEVVCPSPLSEFLCERAEGCWEVANFLHWFLSVEAGSAQDGPSSTMTTAANTGGNNRSNVGMRGEKQTGEGGLASRNEVKEPNMFRRVHMRLMARLVKTKVGIKWQQALLSQEALLSDLQDLGRHAKEGGKYTADWVRKMRAALTPKGGGEGGVVVGCGVNMSNKTETVESIDTESKGKQNDSSVSVGVNTVISTPFQTSKLRTVAPNSRLIEANTNMSMDSKSKSSKTSFEHLYSFGLGPAGTSTAKAVRCPLRPEKRLVGIIPSETTMFKSALAPLLITFKTSETARPKPSGGAG